MPLSLAISLPSDLWCSKHDVASSELGSRELVSTSPADVRRGWFSRHRRSGRDRGEKCAPLDRVSKAAIKSDVPIRARESQPLRSNWADLGGSGLFKIHVVDLALDGWRCVLLHHAGDMILAIDLTSFGPDRL